MKARIERLDAFYEVVFSRPAFNRVSSFVQIIEPIHDALSEELFIPPDAIRVENGNTIDSAVVSLNLTSPTCVMEARLNGYRAHFFELRNSNDIERAKRCMSLFETAASRFLQDGRPAIWKLRVPFWLAVDGGYEAIKNMIRRLTWRSDERDPFEVGATETRSVVRFESSNDEECWSVGIHLERSVLPNTHLFLDISAEYAVGSCYGDFDSRVEHVTGLVSAITNKLELVIG